MKTVFVKDKQSGRILEIQLPTEDDHEVHSGYSSLLPIEQNWNIAPRDEAQNALDILRQCSYQPKIFCYADRMESPGFVVESGKWNWVVNPVTRSNIQNIPRQFLDGIRILAENNVKIDAVGIATPKLKESVSRVIREEVTRSMNIALNITEIIILLTARALGSSVNNSELALMNMPQTASITFNDPVLLVKINNRWLEIGRWE